MKFALVLAAAGLSSRIGKGPAKQFRPLGGIPLFEWTLRKALQIENLETAVVLLPPGHPEPEGLELGHDLQVLWLPGGATRYETVRSGLEKALSLGYEAALVHDAARPFASADLFRRVASALEGGADACVPLRSLSDTVKSIEDGKVTTVPREHLRLAQTPQGLCVGKVLAAYDAALAAQDTAPQAAPPTDDVLLAEIAGLQVVAVEGEPFNFKITYEEDFAVAEALVASGLVEVPSRRPALGPDLQALGTTVPRGARAGVGFDAHRLVEGVPLYLGGLEIPYSRGLEGHSDGDVVSHAVVDALLGAARLGDIGTHYPSSDCRHRGRRSTDFVREVAELLQRRGFQVLSVDVTVIAEAPRLETYKEPMSRSLAEALGVEESKVSVKATTTDGLGITGSGEGMAALAVAVVGSAGGEAQPLEQKSL